MSGSGRVVGLIPARGGSKGLPGKNLRTLGGKPLIVHTIEQALASPRLDRVVVSTDDEAIADAARHAGAEVPFMRPAQYATDESPSMAVVHHALAWFSVQGGGYRPDAVALLAPTCPLRLPAHIDAVIDLLDDEDIESACTVTLSPAHPYWVLSRDENGRMRFAMDADSRPLRRQDMPPFYVHRQSVLVSRTGYLKRVGHDAPFLNFESLLGHVVDPASAHDIDDALDLEVAERLMAQRDR